MMGSEPLISVAPRGQLRHMPPCEDHKDTAANRASVPAPLGFPVPAQGPRQLYWACVSGPTTAPSPLPTLALSQALVPCAHHMFRL